MSIPRPRAVAIFSLSLFAIFFVVFALQLGAKASAPTTKAKAATNTEAAPVETTVSEAEEPVTEYVEPEYEEVPPVVTSSS